MTPSHHSWPPYFTPERPRAHDNRALGVTMRVWAVTVLLVALAVILYLLVLLVTTQ